MVSMVNGEEPATPPAATDRATEAPPAIPATPAAVDSIVYARKFTLKEGYKFDWCKERPLVKSGYLLVLKVNPDLVFARQCAEPVLYVGNQTAQRLNIGYKSGHVVAIVPGDPDLNKSMIWFGTPELPERVDTNMAKAENASANAAGITPFSSKKLQTALGRGSKALEASTVVDVLRVAAGLIRQYSPAEEELAKSIVPTPEPAPTPAEDDEE
jgi:hypothetical protein